MSTPAAPSTASDAATERTVVLPFTIKEKGLLYATYMSMIQNGAIFVPTKNELKLGDPVFVMLTLPESLLQTEERFPIRGKVIWWTPPRAMYKRVRRRRTVSRKRRIRGITRKNRNRFGRASRL